MQRPGVRDTVDIVIRNRQADIVVTVSTDVVRLALTLQEFTGKAFPCHMVRCSNCDNMSGEILKSNDRIKQELGDKPRPGFARSIVSAALSQMDAR